MFLNVDTNITSSFSYLFKTVHSFYKYVTMQDFDSSKSTFTSAQSRGGYGLDCDL